MSYRVHIFGASGSGTTTLAAELSAQLDVPHFDADDYFWKPTDPPFTEKVAPAERTRTLGADLSTHDGWILSGCVAGWGDPLIVEVDLSVFMRLDHDKRIDRLMARERERYGDRIAPGGDMFEIHMAFIAWAKRYETAGCEQRSLSLHEARIMKADAPVLRLDSNQAVEDLAALCVRRLASL